jgi:hypothetical protein
VAQEAVVSRTCLAYAPAVVNLTGTLRSKMFPAQPNSDAAEGQSKAFWFLMLDKPICTVQAQSTDKNTSEDLWNLQLIVTNAELYQIYWPLLDKNVKVVGSLYAASSFDHHTKALLRVISIEIVLGSGQ